MLRMMLTAALTVAFFEAGAQTPPAPPAPPTPTTPQVTPAPRAPVTPAPRPMLPPGFDDFSRDRFDRAWQLEDMQRALEASRFDQEEARRLAREAREEARFNIEMNREHIEEARRLAEQDWARSMRDWRDLPTPMPSVAPLPSIPPLPPVPPMGWDDALQRLDMGYAPRAMDMMPRAAWLPQDPADSLYRAARDHLSRGQYRTAAETFRLLSQKYPSSGYAPDGMYYEAFSLYKIGGQNELRTALDVLERQKSRFPQANNPDPALTTRIRGELANRGDRSAAEAVAKTAAATQSQCNKEEMAVRIEALNALSRMNVDSTTPILRRVLTRRDECSVTLRRQAITLLGKNADAATTDLMVDVLKNDPSMEVRRAALSWLGETPSERGNAALEEILRSPKDEELQASALRALSSSRNPRSSQALRAIIDRKDVSESVRGEAMLQLTRVDSVGSAAYLRSIYPKLESRRLKERALTAIARVRDPETQKWMMQFVRDTTEPVELRRSALSTITRSSSTPVADVGALYKNVSELELRQYIITTLASRKEPEAVDQLIAIYRSTTDPKLQVQIINVLSRRDDPRTQKLLLEILNK